MLYHTVVRVERIDGQFHLSYIDDFLREMTTGVAEWNEIGVFSSLMETYERIAIAFPDGFLELKMYDRDGEEVRA